MLFCFPWIQFLGNCVWFTTLLLMPITCKIFLWFLLVKQINRVNCSSNLIDLDFKFLVIQEFKKRTETFMPKSRNSFLLWNFWVTRNLKSKSIKFEEQFTQLIWFTSRNHRKVLQVIGIRRRVENQTQFPRNRIHGKQNSKT